jgi:hypothetical protein
MKILFLAVLTVALSGGVHAQTSKGKMMIGGYSNFSFQSNAGVSSRVGNVMPNFGYFIKNKLAVGLGFNYYFASSSAGTPTQNSWSYAPYVRYYKYTSNEKFAFFAQALFEYYPPGGGAPKDTYSFVLHPGFVYFFTPHWGIDLELSGITIGHTATITQFTFATILNPTLGFKYYFGK